MTATLLLAAMLGLAMVSRGLEARYQHMEKNDGE